MQVGPYRIVRQIGAGGMGAVWLAEHTMLGRSVAIKVLHPELSSRPQILNRFFNEARAATSVADPGIVQIFDFGQQPDGSAYLVMELLDGEPLDRRLARHGVLGLPEAVRVMRQVSSTLGAAHARGIVHRDLKPENIFIVRDPEVPGGERAKVLDFGIAKLADNRGAAKTETSAVLGTPMYMSPEQCRGAGAVDQRSDVYSLGCVLFRLLCGRAPFESDGPGEIIAMHLRETPPRPSSVRPGLSPALDQLVLRCLAKDPAQRFASGTELATALGALPVGTLVLGTGDIASTRPPTATTLSSASGVLRSVSPVSRTSALLIAGTAIGVVGGTVAVVASRGGGGDRPPVVAVHVEPHPVAPPDPGADIAARMAPVLAAFAPWSSAHAGAPCPDAAALGAALDPWGHPFRITCTEQPDDQRVGVVSDGPDGAPGTGDDIASWRLGREVTEAVRGARWIAAAAAPVAARAEPAAAPPTSSAAAPTAPPAAAPSTPLPPAKPAASPPKPAEPKPRKPARVQLDENGLPVSR